MSHGKNALWFRERLNLKVEHNIRIIPRIPSLGIISDKPAVFSKNNFEKKNEVDKGTI